MNSHYHQVHYGVFHTALPAALKGNSFKDFKDSVLTNRGNDFILGIWNRFRALNAEESSVTETQITKTDIEVSLDDSFGEGQLYLIKTPKTKEPLEAAYIAIAIANDKPIESLRYFTCEMPMQEGAGWVIGEVHGLGRRSNHGTVQQLSLDAFKNTVLLLLGWTTTKLLSNQQSLSMSESTQTVATDGPVRQSTPVPTEVREGQIRHFSPDFFPDLTNGKFAASGIRGPLRFVSNGESIGLYSTQQGLRSKFINRGAIIKVDDQQIRYFVSNLSERDSVTSTNAEKNHGPLLNFQKQGSSSGEQTVTVSMEKTHLVSRSLVDQNISNSSLETKPSIFPYFWNYKHRFATWLTKSSMPIFYEIEGSTKDAYQALIDAGSLLGNRGGCFYDKGEQFIDQSLSRKGGGGVSSVLDSEPMLVGTFPSKYLQLNFQPLSFVFERGSVLFLPEEFVTISAHGRCTAVPYAGLKYQRKSGIRLGIPVPSWAQPIGYVWQYMNKDGSPDRRYSNNLQIPQYQTWELDFSFGKGFSLDTAFLDKKSLDNFVTALDQLVLQSMNRTTPKF